MQHPNDNRINIRTAWFLGIICLFTALNTSEEKMNWLEQAVDDLHRTLLSSTNTQGY